jgi:hypothetical protein
MADTARADENARSLPPCATLCRLRSSAATSASRRSTSGSRRPTQPRGRRHLGSASARPRGRRDGAGGALGAGPHRAGGGGLMRATVAVRPVRQRGGRATRPYVAMVRTWSGNCNRRSGQAGARLQDRARLVGHQAVFSAIGGLSTGLVFHDPNCIDTLGGLMATVSVSVTVKKRELERLIRTAPADATREVRRGTERLRDDVVPGCPGAPARRRGPPGRSCAGRMTARWRSRRCPAAS